MKKKLAMLLVGAMMSVMLGGCGTTEEVQSDVVSTEEVTEVVESVEVVEEVEPEEVVQLRFSWWGSDDRNELTIEAIEYYESLNPNVDIVPEYAGWDGYEEKFMAQLAGENAPDIMTLVAEWYPAIIEADGFYDLTDKIDLSGHNETIVENCTYNGQVLGVNMSVSSYGFSYNKTLLDELGLEVPTGDYTWSEIFELFAQVYENSNGEVYGIPDLRVAGPAWVMEAYGLTELQKEEPYMMSDTEITMTGDDVIAFMQRMEELPEGSMLSAAESLTIDQHTMSACANRQTAFEITAFGSFSALQAQTEDELGLLPYPVGPNGETGNTARPGIIMSVANNSEYPEEAIAFIDWFTNSEEAARILTLTRGVLPTEVQRNAVTDLLTETDLVMSNATDIVYSAELHTYSSGPLGGSDVRDIALQKIGEMVAFGELTAEESGAEFDKLVEFYVTQ
ncbi:MAG: ABC transporter substrate-binding protein [Eubacteriales bacterium]